MSVNKMIFRKYDIRGVVGEDVTPEVAELIGKGFGTFMKRTHSAKTIVVGGDVRLSTFELKEAVVKGLLSTGCDVTDIGILPTPVFYFSSCHLHFDGGIMITASHNPPQDNGFKLCEKNSFPVFDDDISKIYGFIAANDFENGNGTFNERTDLISMYMDYIAADIHIGPRKIKVVTDCGNATAGVAAPELLRRVGCDVTELFTEPNGNFPNHHPDPTIDKYIEVMMNTMRDGNYDAGFGYDGDADRIGLVDENGRSVPGGFILLLLALDLVKKNPGSKVLYDVKCSRLLNELILQAGGEPMMGQTGHAFMKRKLFQTGAILGGELSGHIVFNDRYYPFDDAIYVSLRLAEYLSHTDQKLSELVDWRDRYVSTPEIRIECPDDVKFLVIQHVVEKFKARYKTIDIDGARVEFEHGWGLVRASNTQPRLVMRCEATDEKPLEEIRGILENAVEEAKSSVGAKE